LLDKELALERRKNMKYVTKKEDVPEGPHFVVLTFPKGPNLALRRSVVEYQATVDEDDWMREMEYLTNVRKVSFITFRANAQIETPVEKIAIREDFPC
jgi:hypothetical protein